MQKSHWAEVWMMWRNKYNFRLNTLLTVGVWLNIFGIISLVTASFYDETNRILFIILASILFGILIVSFFIAAGDVWKRDTTKLPQIIEHKNDVSRYVSSRFSHIYLRNDQQVDIEVEWFNHTLFTLVFESAHDGIVRINELQRKIASNDKRICQPSSFCSYTVTLMDKDAVDLVRDSISQNRSLRLFLVFSLGGKVTYEWNEKPESARPFDVQCHIESMVIPQKV